MTFIEVGVLSFFGVYMVNADCVRREFGFEHERKQKNERYSLAFD